MGEPPFQVSLHGALQSSLPSLEGVYSRFSSNGTTWSSNKSPEGKSSFQVPSQGDTSGQYPLSSLLKEPPSPDPSGDGIHYSGGTVYAPPMEALPQGEHLSLTRQSLAHPVPAPFVPVSILSFWGRLCPRCPTEDPKTPLLSQTGAGLPLSPLPSGGTSALAPSPCCAALSSQPEASRLVSRSLPRSCAGSG